MNLSKTEAAEALRDIDRAADRSHDLRAYRVAGPILMLWGVIWILGYGAMGLLAPAQWGWVWLPLNLVGVAATVGLARRPRGAGAHPANGWRAAAVGLALLAFITATFTVLQPQSVAAYMVFPGLVGGLAYVLVGVWRMTRFVWVGAAVFGVSLLGFYLAQPWLAFWMAGVGGVGLILGGLWMRRG